MKCYFFQKKCVISECMIQFICMSLFLSTKMFMIKKRVQRQLCFFWYKRTLKEISDATLLALWSCFNQTIGKFEFLIKCYVKRLCVYRPFEELGRSERNWKTLLNTKNNFISFQCSIIEEVCKCEKFLR